MIPKSKWVWYGFSGHSAAGGFCAYHLCTRIGNLLVSTVGAYFPDRESLMESLGAGPRDYYETMVFECHGEDACGNPNRMGSEILVERYERSLTAEHGHRFFCKQAALGKIQVEDTDEK